jgi:hypothetical protein
VSAKKPQLHLVTNNNVINRDSGPRFHFDLLAVNAPNTFVDGERVSREIHQLNQHIFRCDPSCPICHGLCSHRPITADDLVSWLLKEKRHIRTDQRYYENDCDWLQQTFQHFFKRHEITPEKTGENVLVLIELFYKRGSVWATVEVRHTD